MAKYTSRNQIVNINGIDVSAFVKSVDFDAIGLKKCGPVVIAGVWADDSEACVVCRSRFTPGPEGAAHVVANDTGEDFGVVCPSCGVAIVAPNEASA